MYSVIKDLYEGNLCPISQYSHILGLYRKKRKMGEGEYEKLLERLNMDEKKQLEALMDEHWVLEAMELEQSFSNGFILGMRLMCEVFMMESVEEYLEKLTKGDK